MGHRLHRKARRVGLHSREGGTGIVWIEETDRRMYTRRRERVRRVL